MMKTILKILTATAIVAGAISTGYTVEPAEAGAAKNINWINAYSKKKRFFNTSEIKQWI